MGKLSRKTMCSKRNSKPSAIKHHENASSRVNIWSDSLLAFRPYKSHISTSNSKKIQLQPKNETTSILVDQGTLATWEMRSKEVLAKRAITEGQI
ncbi:hypothetical protein AVEN_19025-1 [Araneus ventricosus]|uniref:Uncharacterized protein n=1 Tax=Araneus ventricosus TaxID=182803 RepID=A0A4Y2KL06_ARAVE|nr:hypothetical protein AVEN_19025-1 [Araneus ventricosus]